MGQAWSSRLSYLLAAVGSAVGLGNIWRFPYLCYRNGGACFLIPYAMAFCCLGVPLLALETGLGQGLGKSALGAFESLSPRLKGLGWVCFVSTSAIVIYYNVVLAWCLRYFLASFDSLSPSGLPWQNGQASKYFQGTVLNKAFLCGPNLLKNTTFGNIDAR